MQLSLQARKKRGARNAAGKSWEVVRARDGGGAPRRRVVNDAAPEKAGQIDRGREASGTTAHNQTIEDLLGIASPALIGQPQPHHYPASARQARGHSSSGREGAVKSALYSLLNTRRCR